jgi:hypothetical protein
MRCVAEPPCTIHYKGEDWKKGMWLEIKHNPKLSNFHCATIGPPCTMQYEINDWMACFHFD